ncbi:MAG: NAD(P)/FAD-dependent oxidoreductase [Sphingobacteriales bacterium]|nr:MAG: NAD(P)/FAD-dependent oxidoreductase [Sphingobacteriales bacterium]
MNIFIDTHLPPPANTYDVVIVGGGLGGLLSAVLLAKEGMKVCMLEKDKQIGGCLQTFGLQKKVFDSCVHYIGGLGEGHTLNKIFSYAGILDKLSLKPYDTNGFDRMAFGNEELLYPQAIGAENFKEQLLQFFPQEKAALDKYIALLKTVGDHFPLYRLRMGDAAEKSAVSNWQLSKVLNELTGNQQLQSVLAGNNLLYAGTASQTPFYLHSLVLESYIHSAHKVMPGSSQISKHLWQQLLDMGSEVIKDTEVVKLAEENGHITYAETGNGERYYGKHFIANIAPEVLLKLVDSSQIRPAYHNRINGLEQTTSCFMLNMVVQPGTVPMCHYNIYWNATHNVWQAVDYKPNEWPANYAVFFTEDAENPGYAESVSALSYMHYTEVAQWQHTVNLTAHREDRGESYREFKQQRSELLLDKLYQRIPELKGHIMAHSAATPLTYRDYTATPKGSLYGILKDVNKPAETTISTRTRIPNLLLTGQNVNLHGVLGVSITAVATAAELVGMEHLLKKINPE